MLIDEKTKEPYINIWFGNFYRPAYDDKEFVKEAIVLLKKLGFNSVLLDAKAWEDFRERYEGKEASPYVSIFEYTQKELENADFPMSFWHFILTGTISIPISVSARQSMGNRSLIRTVRTENGTATGRIRQKIPWRSM